MVDGGQAAAFLLGGVSVPGCGCFYGFTAEAPRTQQNRNNIIRAPNTCSRSVSFGLGAPFRLRIWPQLTLRLQSETVLLGALSREQVQKVENGLRFLCFFAATPVVVFALLLRLCPSVSLW